MDDSINYMVIKHITHLNASGAYIKTCFVTIESNKSKAIKVAKKMAAEIESVLPSLFCGFDHIKHIDVIDGNEIVDVNHDILFTDVNGRQAASILIRTEQEVCDFIIDKVEKEEDKTLQLEDTISTPMYDDDEEGATKYLPLNIKKREYEDEDGNVDFVYDIEMLRDGDLYYVETIDNVGFRTLANIYVSLLNS